RGDPRGAAQGIRRTIARVLGLHSLSGRKGDAAERAVGTTIHRDRRERAGKDSAYENELLILQGAAHTVIVGGPDEHPDLLALQSGTDQVPAASTHLLVNCRRRLSHRLAATRIQVLLSLRSGWNRHARPVP